MQMGVLDVVVQFKPVQPLQGKNELCRIELQVGLRGNMFGLLDDDGVGQWYSSSMRGVVVDDP
jgi:hypothetical protein